MTDRPNSQSNGNGAVDIIAVTALVEGSPYIYCVTFDMFVCNGFYHHEHFIDDRNAHTKMHYRLCKCPHNEDNRKAYRELLNFDTVMEYKATKPKDVRRHGRSRFT